MNTASDQLAVMLLLITMASLWPSDALPYTSENDATVPRCPRIRSDRYCRFSGAWVCVRGVRRSSPTQCYASQYKCSRRYAGRYSFSVYRTSMTYTNCRCPMASTIEPYGGTVIQTYCLAANKKPSFEAMQLSHGEAKSVTGDSLRQLEVSCFSINR